MRPVRLHAPDAPAPKGFYSPAVRIGNLIFTAGQLPLDPKTGECLRGSVEEQTDLVIRNTKALLETNGSSLEHVVKSTIFIRSTDQWDAVNKVYSRYFENTTPPARGIYCGLDIKYGLDIEMEVVAAIAEPEE